MKGETPTFDEYRTGYVAEKHNLPDNAAKALQLFELGYSISGATQYLPVTESTVRSYHKRLQSEIHENVVMSIAGHGRDGSLDVWGSRDIGNFGNLSYEDGVADARESETQTTDSREQIAPNLREREKPLNKGVPIEEIPKELITLDHNVEVEG